MMLLTEPTCQSVCWSSKQSILLTADLPLV